MSRLEHLLALGFDLTEPVEYNPKQLRVRCSQCAALVVNNTATHEHGCPNATHECRGCNAVLPTTQRWCEDCAS